MATEEKRDIGSIMGKLMKKQQELAEMKAKETAEIQPVQEAPREAEAVPVQEQFDANLFEEPAAEEQTAVPEENTAATDAKPEEKTGDISDSVFMDILDDVMSSDIAGHDDAEIAAKVQEIYSDYLRTGVVESVSSEQKEKPVVNEADTAAHESTEEDIGNLIDDYFTPAEEEISAEEKENKPWLDDIADNTAETSTYSDAGSGDDVPAEESAAEPEKKENEDDLLMAALGYTNGDNISKPSADSKKKKRVEGKLGSDLDGAFAYNGAEYKSNAQNGEINGAYDREMRFMYLRMAGTGLFAVLLIIFDLLGAKFTGALDPLKYPVVNIMVSLQLLLLCALFSAGRIYRGLLGLVKAHPTASSVTAASVILTIIYNIMLAVVTGSNPGQAFTLYNSAAGFCLCFQVASDYMRLLYERRNFEKISSFDDICYLEKNENKPSEYVLRRAEFTNGYFRHTNRYNPVFSLENYIIAPVAAIALILFIISLAAGRHLLGSLNVFIVTILMALPVFSVVSLEIPFYIMNLTRTDEPTAILHETDTADYDKVEKIVLSEIDVFDGGQLSISGMSGSGDSDMFRNIEAVSAICNTVGGTITEAFKSISTETGVSDGSDALSAAVKINRVCEGGINADYNGKNYVLGSARFLSEYGIPCQKCNDKEYTASHFGTVAFHMAADGRELHTFYINYVPNPNFTKMIQGLADKGIETEIRCLDPNLSSEFVSSLIGAGNLPISIVRVEDVEEDESLNSTEGESQVVSDGADWMAAITAAEVCRKYRHIATTNRTISLCLALLFAAIAIVLGISGIAVGLQPLYLILLYLVSIIPSILLSIRV